MKHIILTSLLIFFQASIFFSFTAISIVNAHTIDHTTTLIYVEENNTGGILSEDTLQVNISMGWIMVQEIFNTYGVEENITNITDISVYSLEIKQFITQELVISNNNTTCEYGEIDFSDTNVEQIVIDGLTIQLDAICNQTIENILVFNTMFLSSSPNQTNTTTILSGPENVLINADLDANSQAMQLNVSNPEMGVINNDISEDDQNNFVNDLVQNVPDLLAQDGFGPIIIILLISIVVGALHTLEAGHSKAILASIMIDKRMTYKKGLAYVGVFTFTHMADILIVAVVLLILDSFANIYQQLILLQSFAFYAFAFLSASLFLKAISDLTKQYILRKLNIGETEEEHGHSHDLDLDDDKTSIRSQLGIAFITGLAPCLMGWTILFLVLASGRIWLMIPVIVAFAVGIFLVEVIFMILVKRFSNLISDNIGWVGHLSPLISSSILLIVSISLLV